MDVGRDEFRESVVYQIYPRSFDDADGDGVGDLRGVVERLDYLDELGVDVVWLNPVYDSPLADNGYDVRDYRAILDEYGTMADWEALRDGLHDRGMALLMDLVVNHTSDEHEWFRRSRRGEAPYDDYYHWRPGDPGEPPNNWESFFGGPAWSYDDERGAWYLHLFDDKQPDLNWSNPAVREELYDVMRWWLERGVDGFRIDVINVLSKREGLPDGDPDAGLVGADHFISGPRIHEYVREMHERVLAAYDAITVGETLDVTPEEAGQFADDGLDAVFPFDHVLIDRGEQGPWDIQSWGLDDVRRVLDRWQRDAGDAWVGLYLSNHDQPRSVSRFGDEAYRYESATMLATMLFTLRGTPFVYQGEEIGMTNASFEELAEYRDAATFRKVEVALEAGDHDAFEAIADAVNYWSRDNARTPMQWSDDPNAGFTDGEPWIKVNRNYPEVNVEAERERDRSVLRYYRRLVDLRHEHPVLVYGDYEPLLGDHPRVLAYRRVLDDGSDGTAGRRALVVCNAADEDSTVDLRDVAAASDGGGAGAGPAGDGGAAGDGGSLPHLEDATLLVGNYDVADGEGTSADAGYDATAAGHPAELELLPYEARVYLLD